MASRIRIIAAEPNFLARKGLVTLISENKQFELVSAVQDSETLLESLLLYQPDVLIVDYNSFPEGTELLAKVRKQAPDTSILVITTPRSRAEIARSLESGVISYLLSECESEEISQAIFSAARKDKFLCGKIVNLLQGEVLPGQEFQSVSCEGLNITDRELEIIRYVAEGFSNKEIADKLFLSTHTVTTHRKNIMNKLQVNNTAGLVLFAVRNNLIGPNKFLFS